MLLDCGVGDKSPLDCKEIQPVCPKGNQSWIFIGRTAAEAETPILWLPDAKSWFIWKDPDTGKDWGQEEKGMTEDEMVGWHHWLNGHGFGWTLGVGDGQGGLACCGSWGRKESDTTERLNWTDDNMPLTRWLKQRFVVSQFWRLKMQSQRVGRVDSLVDYREGPVLGLSLWFVDGHLHDILVTFSL